MKKNATFKEQFYISLEKKINLHRGCTEPCNGKNDVHTEAWNIFPLFFFFRTNIRTSNTRRNKLLAGRLLDKKGYFIESRIDETSDGFRRVKSVGV